MDPNQVPAGSPWWSRAELARGLTEHDGVEQLAEAWGCSEKTIRKWADRHGLELEAV
ncbi:hypothetical protein [Halorarum salinum]|uniref:Helix-turn-helix domain-containing protein n=1 Tax=Halorarum salinum TaxID=2743089 RepID=A0A7D5QB32_9EURY|nr:hypothetical protein [Halobaculum salinum]QLG62857.1 hypothetical protein HUG12_14420 [Halobaculum salinum]